MAGQSSGRSCPCSISTRSFRRQETSCPISLTDAPEIDRTDPAADPQPGRDQGHLGRIPAASSTTAASSTPRAGTTGSGPTASACTASTSTTSRRAMRAAARSCCDWFRDRFAAGPPTKNINTVAPFLTLAYLLRRRARTAPGCRISTSGPNGSWTACRAPRRTASSTSCSTRRIASSSGTTR